MSLNRGTGDLDADAAVETSMQHASKLLGVPRDHVVAESVEAQEFTDASLGCPRAGQMYAQVVTPGYVVVVRGGNRLLEYHVSALNGSIVLCGS